MNSTAPRRYHDNLDPALLESMPQPLTDRQHAFARLMARGARPVEAFKRAGYAPRHARRTVHRLLRDPRILDAIESTERRIYAGKLAGIRARIDQLTARFNKPRRWDGAPASARIHAATPDRPATRIRPRPPDMHARTHARADLRKPDIRGAGAVSRDARERARVGVAGEGGGEEGCDRPALRHDKRFERPLCRRHLCQAIDCPHGAMRIEPRAGAGGAVPTRAIPLTVTVTGAGAWC